MDTMLLVVVLALVCIGLVMVYSAREAFVAVSDYNDASYFFQKQLLGAVLGLAAMLVTIRVDYREMAQVLAEVQALRSFSLCW